MNVHEATLHTVYNIFPLISLYIGSHRKSVIHNVFKFIRKFQASTNFLFYRPLSEKLSKSLENLYDLRQYETK